MPNVGRSGDARTDVIGKVAGQVKDQMTDTIPKRKRIMPELGFREWVHPFMKTRGVAPIFGSERGGDSLRETTHAAICSPKRIALMMEGRL